jgi:putative ABC transport system permease protein
MQAFKMAIKSIIGNKVRSLLTMLGVIIGVSAVIAATSFAEGSTKKVTDSIQSLGTNLVQVSITGRNSNRNVTYEDMVKLKEDNSSVIGSIAPTVSSSLTVKYGGKSKSATILGTSPEYEEIKSTHVQSGRFLAALDIDFNQKVALIGTAVAKELFGETDPLNKIIKINGLDFKVVGLLQERASSQTGTEDDQVIVPVSVATRLTRNATIRNFVVQGASADTVDACVTVITEYLTKIYKTTNSFKVYNQAQMLSTLNTVTSSMMMILGGIAAISLIVGGIGIMNIMLVSVTERTKEIGIRKSIGAKKRNILTQFLIEALMVTGIGGIIGVLLGLAIIKFIIGGFKITEEVYSMKWIVMSFSISLIIGVIFGLYPARKAASLNPIDALMYE